MSDPTIPGVGTWHTVIPNSRSSDSEKGFVKSTSPNPNPYNRSTAQPYAAVNINNTMYIVNAGNAGHYGNGSIVAKLSRLGPHSRFGATLLTVQLQYSALSPKLELKLQQSSRGG